MRIKCYIYLPFILLSALFASAQDPHINFTSLTSRDGLLSNSVNAILKDRYGLMWFATDDGLNKFDGTNFTVYRRQPGDSSSLRANEILALHEDKSGNLWIATSGGAVSIYDRKMDNFINYPLNGSTPGFLPNAVVRGICSDYQGKIWIAQFESPFVLDPATGHVLRVDLAPYADASSSKMALNCIFEDSHHSMWIGTDKGLFLYLRSTGTFRQFRHDSSDRSSLPNDEVRALGEDRSGHLWVGTDEGLCMMRPGESGFVRYKEMDVSNEVLGHQTINAIAADRDGILWVATMRGLHAINPQKGHSVCYMPDEENLHSLTSQAVRSIYIDKDGIYWFGTYQGGINKYDKNLNLFNIKLSETFHYNNSGSVVVTSFAGRADGNVWVGTDGAGLYIFDRKTELLRPFDIRINGKIASSLSVLSLAKARDNKLYVGTFGHGLIILDPATGKMRDLPMGTGKNELNGRDIYCIREDSHGQIWVGTNGQGVNVLKDGRVVARYTPAPKAANDVLMPVNGYIRAIEEDKEGNIWIGSHGGGLAVYYPNTGGFEVYKQNDKQLPNDKIHSLLLDSKGKMWIGTYGGGLSVFDKKTGQFTNFSEKDGLQNTTIYQVLEDAQGKIWVSTNTGVSSFDPGTKTFHNYTHYNGLQDDNFVHGAGIRLSDGELFFGGHQGFNFFNPAVLTTNRNVPAVIVTDLRIANKTVTPGKGSPIREQISAASEIRLDYRQNFALSFVALNYTIPKQNHYAYKLDGFDKDWNHTGPMNTAYYTNLDPGEYVFHVKASNNDGVWSTGDTSIKIYVRPPFWLTIYAYIFYVLAACSLLLYSRHRGITKLRRKFALEQERFEVRRVQEIDRLKLKFLTNLSHEFRTPISLIMGPVDQLLSTQTDRRAQDKLNMVKRNARRLLNLVNQLLDFRKMEDQELRLHLSEGEFVTFVEDICQSFTDLSERKHITFAFESESEGLYVLFDRDKIERILFNLLSNAFKFTLEGGTVRLSLKEQESEDDRKWVSVMVTDTGIGIPEDKKERIFDRFFQSPSANAILNQGSGIGLSITKEFVKMHGGTIEVDSEPGRGSIFTIRLPLATASGPAKELMPSPEAPGIPDSVSAGNMQTEVSGNGADSGLLMPVILLVEDNEDFRFYLKENLRHQYKVLEAADGKEGWQKALSNHPHLIVSDVSMPFMDGITLTRKLKADKRTNHIPVVLLTALTGEGQQLTGLGTGANDYITKPFNFEVLNARIKNLLELRNTLKTTFTRRIKVDTPEVKMESDDEKLLRKVAGYIEENLTNPQLSVELLSREMGMSRSSLYSKLLEISGEKPVEYIRSYKLNKAAVLLEKSDMTIAEIAYQVGFSTPNYFARAFKAKFDLLPSAYAARIKNVEHNGDP
ncbi:hybrid sensor histidine kinase/response regulator transcription factor [Flavitalea flava]